MAEKLVDALRGTLILMVRRALYAMRPMHGFGIARPLEQISENALPLNEDTVYTSLLRLQQEGSIASKWDSSENNRRARFNSITSKSTRQLERETKIGNVFPV